MWPQNRLHRCAVVNLSIAVAIEGQTKTLVEINGKEDGGQREGRKIQSRIGCVYAHQPQSWPRRAKFSHGERLRTGFTIHARRCRIQSVHDAAASSSKCLSYPCQPPTNANGMTLVLTHYSKSSFFVQKFNFHKTPTFFTQFFFWIFSWNQSCQQLKSPKPQHFHEFFTEFFFDNFPRDFLFVCL